MVKELWGIEMVHALLPVASLVSMHTLQYTLFVYTQLWVHDAECQPV